MDNAISNILSPHREIISLNAIKFLTYIVLTKRKLEKHHLHGFHEISILFVLGATYS